MNPFEENPIPLFDALENWKEVYPAPYDKRDVDPYTKARVILMNGALSAASALSHSVSRQTSDPELRRALALSRAVERQQQQKISLLKPPDESALEHTISYEQLAIDLTAELAARERDCAVKKALDFALIEDLDHLYRYADLLDLLRGIHAEKLVGGTEIMPGRPTISQHRYPPDNVRKSVDGSSADKQTILSAMIITATERQTLNYYMNVSALQTDNIARRLYEEIAFVEEEHVTQYGTLVPVLDPLEALLWHEYAECYLYWSCYLSETDSRIRSIWEQYLTVGISLLHATAELLHKFGGKNRDEVIEGGQFPPPVALHENIEYVRRVLGATLQFTPFNDGYAKISELPSDADFFRYQAEINPSSGIVPSHLVITEHQSMCCGDYRFEVAPSPVPQLRSRTRDNVEAGRIPYAADSADFECND